MGHHGEELAGEPVDVRRVDTLGLNASGAVWMLGLTSSGQISARMSATWLV